MAPIEDEKGDAVPDTPLVTELKKLDDEYLAMQREYDNEAKALTRKYTEKQQPLLEQRGTVLAGDGTAADASTSGTPALRSFWLKALANHPALEDQIEEWDAEVLEYLKDVMKVDLDPENSDMGFRLKFIFASNPWFTNAVLSKEYHTKEGSPYTQEIEVTEIRGCTVEWKEGKDVTVERVAKKVKGGGAKKAQQKGKVKEEPRSSFFRSFFRSLKEGGRLPDDVDAGELGMEFGEEDVDEEQLVQMIMENDHEVGCAIRDNVIPFAVRWYTGEAAPEGDSDDEESEEEDDDDDDDDDSESESSPKGKKAPKKKADAKPAGAGDKKEEECKQQ